MSAMTMTAATRWRPPLPHQAKEFSDWHERSIQRLIQNSGCEALREPAICGKTPDLLVLTPSGEQCIVECIARLQDQEHAAELHEQGWHQCGGNITELHRNVYSRLQQKATKYREIAAGMPYVIAMFDASCMNSLDTALDMVLSPYAPTVTLSPEGKITGKIYNTLWPTPEIPAALFELYPHLSGFLYSRWPRQHYYLPNPYALHPVPGDPFQFAQVPKLPPQYDHVKHAWRPRLATFRDDSENPPEPWLTQMEQLAGQITLQAK